VYKVLLVDDDHKVLSGYRRILEPYVSVIAAESGAQALETLVSEGPFAVIMVDYYLPRMSGADLLAEMAILAPEATRIMITGMPDVEVAVQAVNRGHVFRFLSKPCEAEMLIDTVLAGVELHVLQLADKEQVAFAAKTQSTKTLDKNCRRGISASDYALGLRRMYAAIGHYGGNRLGLSCRTMAEAAELFAAAKAWREHARASLWLAAMRTKLPEEQTPGESPLAGFVLRSLKLAEEQPPAAFTLEAELLANLGVWARQHGIESALVSGIWRKDEAVATSVALRVQALGPLHMYRDGKEILDDHWKTRKERIVFLYLLANRNRRVDREVLLEKFWPDYDAATAANNFSSMLYNLRSVIGSAVVCYKKGFCWLDKTQYWCDVDNFEQARDLLMDAVRRKDITAANAHFARMRELYAGDFLEEFRAEDWVAQEQQRIRDDLVLGTLALGELLAESGRLADAEHAVMLAPLSRKYSHRVAALLVETLTRQGRPEAAASVVDSLSEEYRAAFGQNLRG
jgi:DNA-binding SARP family transcriptional activator/FixJ family two-component response regulator